MSSVSSLYAKLPFDPVKDFVPVTDGDLDAIRDRRLAEKSGDQPARSWSRSPRKSPAPTTSARAAPARRCTCSPRCSAASTGIKLVHIPYRGDAPMITALISNDIQLAFLPQANGIANVQSNLIRGLGVTGTKRHGGVAQRADRAGAGLQGSRGRKLGRRCSRRPARRPTSCRRFSSTLAKALADPKVRDVAGFDRPGAGRQLARGVRRPVQGRHRALRQGHREAKIPKLD